MLEKQSKNKKIDLPGASQLTTKKTIKVNRVGWQFVSESSREGSFICDPVLCARVCTRREVDQINEAENEIDMGCLRTSSCFVNQPHVVHQDESKIAQE